MRLTIVGSLSGQLSTASKIAMDRGARVTHATSIDQALSMLRAGKGADLLMVDIAVDISSLIRSLEDEHIHIPIVACGIDPDARAAAAAIHAGAKEFIPLPPDPELIAAVLSAVTQEDSDLICEDEAMQSVLKLAKQVAASEASVLITGESGTGKEVIARYLHQNSKRAHKPYISVNCAAIPDNLLESELFGHEKGAFTGAVSRRIGKFEEADGGTLLLDEITEMDIRLQAKLLRALQERVIDRVGGSTPVRVNIRILATSNRDLHQAVLEKQFREDLLFRLNVVNLKLPALRDRPNDVLALANHFIKKYSQLNGVQTRPLTEAAKTALQQAQWSGNVRELENTMHRAVLLANGDTIDIGAIISPDGKQFSEQSYNNPAVIAAQTAQYMMSNFVGQTVADVERSLILDTLDHCLGNRTHAAKILGISIRTLRNKLNEYSSNGHAVPAPGDARQAG